MDVGVESTGATANTPGGDTLFYLVGALSSLSLSLLLFFHVRVFAPGYAEEEGWFSIELFWMLLIYSVESEFMAHVNSIGFEYVM